MSTPDTRADVCRQLADDLEEVAQLAERLEMEGWARHFRHDAEILRIRARREDADANAEAAVSD